MTLKPASVQPSTSNGSDLWLFGKLHRAAMIHEEAVSMADQMNADFATWYAEQTKPEEPQRRLIVGTNNDWGIHGTTRQVGLDAYKTARAAGLEIVRHVVYWPVIAPEPGTWNFEALDRDVEEMRAAGLRILFNIMWAPSWATQNTSKTYEFFACRNSETPDSAAGGVGADFDASIPWCGNPDRIREGAIWGVCGKLVERYRDRVEFWSFWNEPNYPIFYPPRHLDAANDYERYMQEIAQPAADALRYYGGPDLKIVGPDPDDAGTLETLLKHEARLVDESWRAHGGGGLLWNVVVAPHIYSWEHDEDGMRVVPDGVIQRLRNEFLPVVKKYRAGRQFWITETGGNEVKTTAEGLARQAIEVPALVEALDNELEVDAVFIYRLKREDHHDKADHGLVMPDDTPTPALVKIGEYLNDETGGRRRPARR